MRKKIINSTIVLTALFASVINAGHHEKESKSEALLVSGLDAGSFDKSVRPQDDLFRHINGKWLAEFDIPADKSNYGSFTKLADNARVDVKNIIDQAASSDSKQGSDEQKVGDLYKSFMDEGLLEKLGTAPLQPELERIAAIKNLSDLSSYIAYAQMMTDAPFYTWVLIDSKVPDTYITKMGQSGLGLPSRESYLKDDENSEEIRQQYLSHIETMFGLAGLKNGESAAVTVMAMETRLAENQWPKEKLRDPVAGYNKVSSKELTEILSNIDWQRWSKTATLEGLKNILIGQPDYLQTVNNMLSEIPIEDWRTYFTWHLITNTATSLNADLDNENFNFYRGVLSGVKEQESRWKRAVTAVNNSLGEVVGKIYVSKHFTPVAKEKMQTLVENLRDAYGAGIKELEWMGDETKEQALDKLAKFTPKIGYPDVWRDYSSLSISADDLFGNMKRSGLHVVTRNRAKLGKPIDRTEWGMTPQTVNAYYNPVLNEIVFPAAILQPPFFNLEADMAVNYGAIGAVIGHEMGHGFDDQGSQYNGDGKLQNWWTEDDRKEFKARTGKLVAQYSGFTVLDDVHLNGEFTQGENIGDLSGLTIAFKAYQASLDGKSGPVIDGLTANQRVFAGWAQVWARKYRDAELRKRIDTDPHSPSEFRTNGTVMNMPEFYQAFDVKEGDKLYTEPELRVKIW